jgi:hypothetical protein
MSTLISIPMDVALKIRDILHNQLLVKTPGIKYVLRRGEHEEEEDDDGVEGTKDDEGERWIIEFDTKIEALAALLKDAVWFLGDIDDGLLDGIFAGMDSEIDGGIIETLHIDEEGIYRVINTELMKWSYFHHACMWPQIDPELKNKAVALHKRYKAIKRGLLRSWIDHPIDNCNEQDRIVRVYRGEELRCKGELDRDAFIEWLDLLRTGDTFCRQEDGSHLVFQRIINYPNPPRFDVDIINTFCYVKSIVHDKKIEKATCLDHAIQQMPFPSDRSSLCIPPLTFDFGCLYQ